MLILTGKVASNIVLKWGRKNGVKILKICADFDVSQ